MGGKALKEKGIETVRVNTDLFNQYYDEISNILKNELVLETYKVRCYKEKETHGDLDILIKIDQEFYNKGINLKKWVDDRFKPKALNHNGSVTSWEYNMFQIDFIPVKESSWEIIKHFMDFSPIGNLFGKTAHRFGCKFGIDGLVYPFRNFNGRLSHNITISKNPKKIFDFLGYDYDKYLKGFETEEEIFDFIINGKYFNSQIFLFENLRHIDKKRNKKRPDYNRFLTYINDNHFNDYEFKKKEEYLAYINDYFPETKLFEKIEELRIKDEQNKILNSKFNGKLVMSYYPSLKGKLLGDMMTKFKENIGDWKNKFLIMTNEEIMTEFDNFIINKIKI